MTNDEFARIWEKAGGALSIEQLPAFQASSSYREVVSASLTLGGDAIRCHRGLRAALDHIEKLESGLLKIGGSTCDCGNSLQKTQPSGRDIQQNGQGLKTKRHKSTNSSGSTTGSLRQGKSGSSKRKNKKFQKPNESNKIPFTSERYGGPSYRNPPTGGIAKGW